MRREREGRWRGEEGVFSLRVCLLLGTEVSLGVLAQRIATGTYKGIVVGEIWVGLTGEQLHEGGRCADSGVL